MTAIQALQKYFGYDAFRDKQSEIIDQILNGKDVLVLMPTGGGKSLCYQLPAVLLNGLTIVISPLIALMKDQVDSLNLTGIPAAFLNSSQSDADQAAITQKLQNNQIKLLYLAPERIFRSGSTLINFLRSLPVCLIAIDEAHCISQWGHDFRPEYLMLAGLKKEFPKTPVIALTATADKLTQKDILDKLALDHPTQFVSSFNRANITYRVIPRKNSFVQLLQFLERRKDDSGIIYCLSRKATEGLAEQLQNAGYAARAYHAGLENAEKVRNQEAFLRDEVRIIVATIAFGMGINKSNVRYVIHAHLPKNIEGYYQETGRAGRDGLPSDALLLYAASDSFKLREFAKVEGNEEQSAIMLKKLDDMVQYAQLQRCRRQYLMQYFNEDFPDNCGSCDVCLSEVKKFDGTRVAQMALSAVARLKERFGSAYLIDFLRGSKREKIREEHKLLKTYGVGANIQRVDWNRYMRELVMQDYLKLTDDEYPVLQLTEKSDAVLKGLQKVELIATQIEHEQESVTLNFEAGLLNELKLVRRDLAAQADVPAYLIVSDTTLIEIATYLPQNLDDLRWISGFGDIKLARYGREFLVPVKDYSEKNKLESRINQKLIRLERKPEPNRNPGKFKAADTRNESYSMYRSGKSISEIAHDRGLSPATIEGHLSYFIQSGKIDVLEFVKEEKIPAIQDTVESYGIGKLSALKEVLGDNFSYGEIKAVISWMSRNE